MEFVLRPLHLYLMFLIFLLEVILFLILNVSIVPHASTDLKYQIGLQTDMPIKVCLNFGVYLEKSYCFNFL